jgi:hypothetical protein
MFKTTKLLALCLSAVLTACGGGGGGSTPVASVQAFNLKATYVNDMQSTSSKNFTISGTINGIAASGSGTVTSGALQSSTFEGTSALVQTTTVTGTVIANGQNIPYGSASQAYYDSNYNYLGANGSEYSVVTSFAALPTAARVNDTGVFVELVNYPSSLKSYSTGTTVISYSLTADTETSAILSLISTVKDNSGNIISTDTVRHRVTTSNVSTVLSEFYTATSQALTLTYQ